MKKSKQGFTLIELLVVVLIIGILAAIAVPQYQIAVKKSHAARIMPILTSLINAQEVYYLSHGEYTDNARELDIHPSCTETDDPDKWKCDNDFLLDLDKGTVLASYCPGHNGSYADCRANREFQLGFGAANRASGAKYPAPNSRQCWVPDNAIGNGEAVCKSLGKLTTYSIAYDIN